MSSGKFACGVICRSVINECVHGSRLALYFPRLVRIEIKTGDAEMKSAGSVSLIDLLVSLRPLPTSPVHDMCECSECGWHGKTEDCELVADSEGWEYPTYYYHTCPECPDGGGIEVYWSSTEALASYAISEIHFKADMALFELNRKCDSYLDTLT